MASHFSSIGLNLNNQDDFSNYFNLAYKNGEKIRTKLGTYITWHIGNGVELWGQLDKNNTAIGMNPHFSGKSKIKVRVDSIVKRDNDNVLDGALYCWAEPKENEDGSGIYPFVFDTPDMATYGDLKSHKLLLLKSQVLLMKFRHIRMMKSSAIPKRLNLNLHRSLSYLLDYLVRMEIRKHHLRLWQYLQDMLRKQAD